MLLQISEDTRLEDILSALLVIGGAGLGLVVAVGLWMLFARMRRRRAG
jgi:hypothetical protein